VYLRAFEGYFDLGASGLEHSTCEEAEPNASLHVSPALDQDFSTRYFSVDAEGPTPGQVIDGVRDVRADATQHALHSTSPFYEGRILRGPAGACPTIPTGTADNEVVAQLSSHLERLYRLHPSCPGGLVGLEADGSTRFKQIRVAARAIHAATGKPIVMHSSVSFDTLPDECRDKGVRLRELPKP